MVYRLTWQEKWGDAWHITYHTTVIIIMPLHSDFGVYEYSRTMHSWLIIKIIIYMYTHFDLSMISELLVFEAHSMTAAGGCRHCLLIQAPGKKQTNTCTIMLIILLWMSPDFEYQNVTLCCRIGCMIIIVGRQRWSVTIGYRSMDRCMRFDTGSLVVIIPDWHEANMSDLRKEVTYISRYAVELENIHDCYVHFVRFSCLWHGPSVSIFTASKFISEF